MNQDAALRQQLVKVIESSEAHAELDDAVNGFPEKLHGKRPDGCPHSPWQLLEHMRIAQWDILEFTRDPRHESPAFPDGYWPKNPEPPDAKAWDNTVKAFLADRKALCELVANESVDLFTKIPHGGGQTVLRQALLTADHNAYHLGQLLLLRRTFGV
ncbi:DinB family protein [Terracidiphilus sp.]|jgi:DinB superfamily|uniref:DinB family protein n=1 Tax=Terracidiphilus sp. TaxID=1964191 RepID=UPI003C138EE7